MFACVRHACVKGSLEEESLEGASDNLDGLLDWAGQLSFESYHEVCILCADKDDDNNAAPALVGLSDWAGRLSIKTCLWLFVLLWLLLVVVRLGSCIGQGNSALEVNVRCLFVCDDDIFHAGVLMCVCLCVLQAWERTAATVVDLPVA